MNKTDVEVIKSKLFQEGDSNMNIVVIDVSTGAIMPNK